MTRKELKEIIGSKPGIESTIESIEAEFQPMKVHAAALNKRLSELRGQLNQIHRAEKELIALATAEEEAAKKEQQPKDPPAPESNPGSK